MPKGLRGIGLRNVELYNKAFLVKQAMRIHNEPSLLINKVMKGAYKCSSVEAALVENIPCQVSLGFRGMCKSVQAAKRGFGKVIFRGNTRIKDGVGSFQESVCIGKIGGILNISQCV